MYLLNFVFISLWKKAGPLHSKKLESPLPKDDLCQVWLKLAHWFWRRRWKCQKFTTTTDNWQILIRKAHLSLRMIIPCEKTFPWFHYFWHCDLDLGVWPIFLKTSTMLKTWYFTDKTFLWVALFFTLWPWSLTHFLKDLTLLKTFE